jgi:hypothetical protein
VPKEFGILSAHVTRQTPISDLPELLTVDEYAAFWGCARTTVYLQIQAKKIPIVTLGNPSELYPHGKVIRIPRAAIAAMVKESELVGAPK